MWPRTNRSSRATEPLSTARRAKRWWNRQLLAATRCRWEKSRKTKSIPLSTIWWSSAKWQQPTRRRSTTRARNPSEWPNLISRRTSLPVRLWSKLRAELLPPAASAVVNSFTATAAVAAAASNKSCPAALAPWNCRPKQWQRSPLNLPAELVARPAASIRNLSLPAAAINTWITAGSIRMLPQWIRWLNSSWTVPSAILRSVSKFVILAN